VLVALALLVGALVPLIAASEPAAAAGTPVLGPSRLTAAQIAAWFRASTRSPYRASVSVEQLASMFVNEGGAAYVRGDVAFAQSVVETGWFSFPSYGYVKPTDNNFAGIGAYGDGSHLFRAPDAQTGVRGQTQLLRRYADPYSTNANIGYTPVPQLWNPSSNYNFPGGTHGWAPTWEHMTGRWASSPTYTQVVLGVYTSMLAFNGLVGVPDLSVTPFGSFDVAARGVDTISAAGWAIDPTTTASIPVHIYMDGVGAAILTADVSRPDVAAAVPGAGAAHGWSTTIAAGPGAHTVCAYAISTSGASGNPSLGCRVVTTNPIGWLDQAEARGDGVHVGGWTIGPSTSGPLVVHVYVDGVGRAILTANQNRPDVGAVFPDYGSGHGFSVTLPLDPTARVVCAYGISPDGGANTHLGCRTINGLPFGSLDIASRSGPSTARVAGWVISPVTTQPVVVHVYADGVGVAILTAQSARPDVGSVLPAYGSAHGFDIDVPVASANPVICAYGINPLPNSANSVLGCRAA